MLCKNYFYFYFYFGPFQIRTNKVSEIWEKCQKLDGKIMGRGGAGIWCNILETLSCMLNVVHPAARHFVTQTAEKLRISWYTLVAIYVQFM